MSKKSKIYVAGIGMVTSVGWNAEMTAASVKSGISQFQETSYLNKNLNPFKMSLVPDDALPKLNASLNTTGRI